MSTLHYIAVVGVGQSLSYNLLSLRGRIDGARIIAPVVKDHERGITKGSIERLTSAIVSAMHTDAQLDAFARLSVWAYEPQFEFEFKMLWQAFGKAAWIEFIPNKFRHKDTQTREYIQNRLAAVKPQLNDVSQLVHAKRRMSPLPLPLLNFQSASLRAFRDHWYCNMHNEELSRFLQSLLTKFRQTHTRRGADGGYAHADDRGLMFAPAGNEICHGKPHPTGDNDTCFVNGRFRFGAALFAGFHYDVRAAHGNLTATLYDCDGASRDMRPERREYLNIFPNDYLLPTGSK